MCSHIGRVFLGVLTGFGLLVAIPLASPSGAAPADIAPADSRKAAPAMSLHDATGKNHELSAYKGRVVLLDFWATWCTGCKLESRGSWNSRRSTTAGVCPHSEWP